MVEEALFVGKNGKKSKVWQKKIQIDGDALSTPCVPAVTK
jgi:hypothetical protein